MIKVEKLSFGFPAKELYKDISFTLETGQHCAFIGSNGTGKTTLIEMIVDPDKYLYDGKIEIAEGCRFGYVNQFSGNEKDQEKTAYEFLSERFVELLTQTEEVCARMATEEDLDTVFEEYQRLLDLSQAMDADNYDSNIRKQLALVGMSSREDTKICHLSGGEYKLLQVMKEMLLLPNLLIMDEPDVFLDFEHMNGLCKLINSYKGTLLVITHNRYLLNNCFNKILHLEDADIQEFDGDYTSYNYMLLQKKIELKEQSLEEQKEIERTEKMVNRLRTNATKYSIASLGRAVHAKQTYLDRLKANAIKAPFVEMRIPKITFPKVEVNPEEVVLQVNDYKAEFDEVILEDVNFEMKAGEKVAIVGANGTGKTTLFYDIFKNQHPSVKIAENVNIGFLSQFYDAHWQKDHTIYEEFFELGFETKDAIREFLKKYHFSDETLEQKIMYLSGGEKNLLQLARIAAGNADLLLLDEPTSHLDTYAQMALEKAISEYTGTVLMVSHDFYTIVNCVDYILFVDDTSVRRMRIRSFRKKIYEEHFSKEYLELEVQKKELETRVNAAIKSGDVEGAKQICEQLEDVIVKMESIK